MEAPTEDFVEIEVGGLPLNPRGPVGRVDDLASIQTEGVITPLVVTVLPDGKLGVISGARRLAYARKHGITSLPYTVRQTSDVNAILTEMLLAQNGQEHPIITLDRQGNVTGGQCLAVWRLLRRWSPSGGWGELPPGERSAAALRLASRFGAKDTDWVYCLESLVTAPPETQRAVASGKMAFSAYRRLRTSPELQKAALEAVGDDEVVTVAKARQAKKAAEETTPPDTIMKMRAVMRALLEIEGALSDAAPEEWLCWQDIVNKVAEIDEEIGHGK